MSTFNPSRPPLVLSDAQFEDMMRKGAFTNVGRVELRRGIISLMSAAYYLHAVALQQLAVGLHTALKASGLRLQVVGPVAIGFGNGFQPVADLVVYDPAWAPPDLDGPLPKAAVRLVIEVAGASLGDELGEKARDYGRSGIAEYWVVDAKGRVLTQHTGPHAQGYSERKAVPFSRSITAATLPLSVALGDLAA